MIDSNFTKYFTVKNLIFFIISILLILFIIQIKDIAILFFACYVIACSTEPLVQKLLDYSPKFNRANASAIVLIGCLLTLCVLLIPIIVIGGNEIKTFAISFPQYIDTLKEFIYSSPILRKTDLGQIDIGGLISSASTVSSKVIGETINLGKNLGSGFIYLIISILMIYYFMADKHTIKNAILKMFPSSMRERTSEIYDAISQKIGGYLIAQIAVMTSVGILITIGLLVLKIDFALILGLISTVFDIVPVVGPILAFIVCLVAVYKYGPIMMLLTTAVFWGAQLIENNFIRPYLFSKLLNLHPLIIYLFLFIAAKYIGIMGVVFAPAIAAMVVVLIEELYMKNIE